MVAWFLLGSIPEQRSAEETAYVGHFGPLTTCCAMALPFSVKMSGRGLKQGRTGGHFCNFYQVLAERSFLLDELVMGWDLEGWMNGWWWVVTGRSHIFWLHSLVLSLHTGS